MIIAGETSTELKIEFAKLVADRYQKEFGDRLEMDQILEPGRHCHIIAEYDQQGRLVAGVKLSAFADSFTARCLGESKINEIFGRQANLDQVVEISKAVNVGGILTITKLVSRTYKWLHKNASDGFVAFGPAKNMHLWNRLIDASWRDHWQARVIPVPAPQIELPDHLDLALLHTTVTLHK